MGAGIPAADCRGIDRACPTPPGGLIARYAAGRLYDPATGLVAGLRPRHYISIASPHLGCTAEMSEAQARVRLLVCMRAG